MNRGQTWLRRTVYCFHFMSLSFCSSISQTQHDSLDALQKSAPNVFIDCGSCDDDYIRMEATFVNYVRDRMQADVHVLITRQRTASGGREYTLTFIGQNRASGSNDTLTFTTKQSDTDDIVRSSLVRVMKVGLAKYVARTPLGEYINVDFKRPSAAVDVTDEWNHWVFRANLNTNMRGQKTSTSTRLSGGLSARRITNDWKLSFSFWSQYDEDKFDYEDTKVSSYSRDQSFDALVVKSLDDHWSVGGFAAADVSTYDNLKLGGEIAPAIEYNIFPYSESTRQQVRIMYRFIVEENQYVEETIFDKSSERLLRQSLSIAAEFKQPWGSISASLWASHFLHDFDKKRISFSAGFSLRLWEGLSINLWGDVSRINDQLSLRKGGATAEEVLLRRTQLATNYRYSTSIGLSYTFGSIYNNIVNPRFGD